MKKQYDKSKCKLLSKDLNVEEIFARNKSVLASYDFTTVLNAIQQKFNRMQGFPCEIQNFGGSFFGSYYLVIYL